ncbi:6-bladed beta-propeller [Bacteroides sp. 224]|uniref:6-bladed beta-propeller n=1 Tax=Bacteroides sp. 224 TaxID=2302936 RepID=UPI0013D1E11B|nr:6-bladed beta-propeller [Bacteroides sp. 224]NDV66538.1 6-bladed beta-propeller [Bacteroides sp. 224]
MSRVFLCILLVFALSSCSFSNKQIQNEDYFEVNFDLLSDSLLPIRVIKYIPLETNENCLISAIDKVIYKHHKFYVFDKGGSAIYVFNENGKRIHTIHQVGNGPGEYDYPMDIDVDKDGNLYVYNHTNQTLLKFPFDNITKGETFIKTGEYCMDFALTESGHIYMSDVVREGRFAIKLARYALSDRELSVLEENEHPLWDGISRASNHYLFRSTNGGLYHYKRFSNQIKFLEGSEGGKDIVFTSKKVPSASRLDKWAENKNAFIEDYEYLRDVSACYENRDYILITFEMIPKIQTIINKHTGKVCNISTLSFSQRDVGYLNKIVAADENYFVSLCSPTSAFLEKALEEDGEKSKVLEGLTEDANSVLVVFGFE